jgi:hypothetical protein
MAWTYDTADIGTTTPSGRRNMVRLLIGDTVTGDQQLQDEEVDAGLAETGNSVYAAAAWCCRILAAKYSRMVDTQLDGALEAKYSDRVKAYTQLATSMSQLGKQTSGRGLGVFAGGIKISEMQSAELDTNRVPPAFTMGQFNNNE